MSRVMVALAVWMASASLVSASLAPPKDRLRSANKVPPTQVSKLVPAVREALAGPEMSPEFLLTDRTEVRLNGKPCKYEAIPHHATIVLMEVAMDNKTILKIHFRTGK
jgi:hypothetical protein